MKDSTKQAIWVVALIVTALPGVLFLLFMFLFMAGGVSWERQARGGNLDLLHLLLLPFYLTLIAAAASQHRRDRSSQPPKTPPFSVPLPAWAVGCVLASCFVTSVSAGGEDGSEVQRREQALSGCRNTPRLVSQTVTGKYYVVVYDRACEASPRHTVNVSVLDQMEPEGPGNVFVAEAPDGSARGAQRMHVFAFAPNPAGVIDVLYDPDARVLTRMERLNELSITFRADSIGGR